MTPEREAEIREWHRASVDLLGRVPMPPEGWTRTIGNLLTALDEARDSIPPAIVAALYPGQPDARPSVEDVCAEIEGLRETSQPPRAVRLKSELRALTLRRKAEHEEEDHDHIVVGDVEVARVEYGETDAEGRGAGDDIGPADVDAWFATPSPTPAPANTAEAVRALLDVARRAYRGHRVHAGNCSAVTEALDDSRCDCGTALDRAFGRAIDLADHAPSAPVERVWTRGGAGARLPARDRTPVDARQFRREASGSPPRRSECDCEGSAVMGERLPQPGCGCGVCERSRAARRGWRVRRAEARVRRAALALANAKVRLKNVRKRAKGTPT